MTVEASNPSVVIVGGGAAGSTCALFLARAGISSTVLDDERTVLKRAWLHNYPGADPVLGLDWLAALRRTASATGRVTFTTGKVVGLARDGARFAAQTDGARVVADVLVLASGQGAAPFLESFGLATTDPVQPYVKTNLVVDRWGETRVPGVFACGLLAGWPSQAVICAGSGANVAVRIASRAKGAFWVDHDVPPPAGAPTA
jgi:thioredoxin reductase (NADPH)